MNMQQSPAITVVSSTLNVSYEYYLKHAQQFYLRGQQPQAQTHFRKAFDISILLLERDHPDELAIQQVINCCDYCFDFCRLPDDDDEHYFLEIASNTLNQLIKHNVSEQLQPLLVTAYDKVATLANELMVFNGSKRCQLIINNYEQTKKDCIGVAEHFS